MPINIWTPEQTQKQDICLQAKSPITVAYNLESLAGGQQTLATFTADQRYILRRIILSASVRSLTGGGDNARYFVGWGKQITDLPLSGIPAGPCTLLAGVVTMASDEGLSNSQMSPQTIDVNLLGMDVYLNKGDNLYLLSNGYGAFRLLDVVTTLYLWPTFA
jgi:hypothetical protein